MKSLLLGRSVLMETNAGVLPTQVCLAVVEARSSAELRRQKREWIVPPQKLEENIDYTKREFIAKVIKHHMPSTSQFMRHCNSVTIHR